MDNEVARVIDQLTRAFSGDAWHGASLNELLRDVTVRQAAARPISGAHSIWEIVLHITVWKETVSQRLAGERVTPTAAEDWPVVHRSSHHHWQETLARLDTVQNELLGKVGQLEAHRMNEKLPGQSVTIYTTLHGMVQHDLYHAGQIALLKKATV